MEFYFEQPGEITPDLVLVVTQRGVWNSDLCSLSEDEATFLKSESEKLHASSKENVVSLPLLCKKLKNQSIVSLRILDLKKDDLSEQTAKELGAKLFGYACCARAENVWVDCTQVCSSDLTAHVACGFKIRSFKFDRYKTPDTNKKELQSVYFRSSSPEATTSAFARLKPLAEAVATVRTLSSEAPNVLTPEAYALQAKALKKLGISVDVLDEKDMAKLGMNALLGVAQGSAYPPFLVTMRWNGGEKDDAPIALVGKGVTFDSGGISLKPSNNMHEMKEDMTGAGIVLATMQMAAELKLPLNIVGVAGMVENMPSGTAQRPSDIVRAMSGLTIEVQNTDAEGRLVLADALHYTQEYFKPKCIIDFATLTGAIQVALGHEFAGLFTNRDALATALTDAGQQVAERLWRLPLDPSFDKDIESDIADIKNVGSGRGAGSCTAAQFLQRFIHDIPWAHIDIAAVTFDKKERPLTGSGFTGFGVRLMHAFFSQVIRHGGNF